MASACSDINRSKQLLTIQKLQSQLQKNKTILTKIPVKELDEINTYFSFHLQKIGDSIEGKSIPKNTALLLDSCKYIIHELNQFNQLKAFVDSTTEQSQSRLNALKHDVIEQAGNRKKYTDYIEIEQNQVEHLANVSTSLQTTSKEISKMAARLATKLNDLTIHFKQP